MGTIPIPSGATIDESTQASSGAVSIPQGATIDQVPVQPTQAQQPPPVRGVPMGTISAPQQPSSYMGKLAKWIDNVTNDVKYGTDLTGVGTVLKKMGAHGLTAGQPEAVGDFMASLPLGLLRATKGAAQVTPQVIGGPQGQTWQGIKNIVGGGLQAITEPAAFAGPEATGVGKAEGTVEQGLRALMADTADKAGVEAPASRSMLGIIEETGNKIKAASQEIYRQLDEASGGRWQRFDDRLEKIRQRMAPLDPELDPEQWERLEMQRAETEVTQTNLIDELVEAGKITADQGEKAKQTYQQAMALFDTKTGLKPAVSGANPDVVISPENPEMADAQQFFKRVDKLHDSGRLQQAMGQENADQLYRTANDAVIQSRQVKPSVGVGAGIKKGLLRRAPTAIGVSQMGKEGSPEEETQPAQPAAKSTAAENTPIWNAFPELNTLADHVIHMEGDSRIARENNNPGNLKKGGEFLKFGSYEEGRNALLKQLKSWKDKNPNWSIQDFNRNYAPDKSHGGDNPDGTEEGRNRYLMNALSAL